MRLVKHWLKKYREGEKKGKYTGRYWDNDGNPLPMSPVEVAQFALHEYLLIYEETDDPKDKLKLLGAIRAIGDTLAKLTVKELISYTDKPPEEEDGF